MKSDGKKEEELLAKRLLELSRQSFHRCVPIYTDFLNLNEQNILHSLQKDSLYARYVTFGGYDCAERQMAAFLPDEALSLHSHTIFASEIAVLRIAPLHQKYTEELTHRDYLGAILNLGLERGKTGDILTDGKAAILFVCAKLKDFLKEELTRVRHTTVQVLEEPLQNFEYRPRLEEIRGTVPSLRLDALLSLAFSASRTKLTGQIETGKVFVNGHLISSNGYQVKEGDLISVRQMGKFRYIESLSVTKKKRIYVLLHKYI